MSQSKCRVCGKTIEWIEYHDPITAENRRIPLDPRLITYQFDGEHWRRSNALASHFSVCSKVEQPAPTQITAQDHVEEEDKKPWYNREDL